MPGDIFASQAAFGDGCRVFTDGCLIVVGSHKWLFEDEGEEFGKSQVQAADVSPDQE